MLSSYFYILCGFFILSGFSIIFYPFKKNEEANARGLIKKYFSYLLIVCLFSLVIFLGNSWVKSILMVSIYLKALHEIYKCLQFKSYKWSVLLLSAVVFIIASFGFITMELEQLALLYPVVVIFDGMSQVGGQLFGKHRIFPGISPNKTYEGLLTGICSVYLVCYIYNWPGTIKFVSFVYISILILFAFLGDIAASWIKRKGGVKDFDHFIPGHGGVMDRFDSFTGFMFSFFIVDHLNFI